MDCLISEKNEQSDSSKGKEVETNSKSRLDTEINDRNNNNNSLIQAVSIYEDLDFDDVITADNEIEVINNRNKLYIKESDDYDYDYLLNPDQTEMNDKIKINGFLG